MKRQIATAEVASSPGHSQQQQTGAVEVEAVAVVSASLYITRWVTVSAVGHGLPEVCSQGHHVFILELICSSAHPPPPSTPSHRAKEVSHSQIGALKVTDTNVLESETEGISNLAFKASFSVSSTQDLPV